MTLGKNKCVWMALIALKIFSEIAVVLYIISKVYDAKDNDEVYGS